MTLVAVEAGTPGFERGRQLQKVGRKGQDTAELFFADCRVPAANILGVEGHGFRAVAHNLARERLAIALLGLSSARAALALALQHTKDRVAFGQPLAQMQWIRMSLAQMHTDIAVLQAYVDQSVLAVNDGTLTAEEAAGAKVKATELQWCVADQCMQMFGGYGYMDEYPISRLWRDARVQRIYGGANEVLIDLVGRRLVKP